MTRSELDQVALSKLVAVLGAAKANDVYLDVMKGLGLTSITTADELMLFAQRVMMRGGFEGAVGGLLSVQAVVRGATTSPTGAR